MVSHSAIGSRLVAALVVALAGSLVACNSIANVDLAYSDADAAETNPGETDGGALDASGLADAPMLVLTVEDAAAVVTSTTVPCMLNGAVCDQTAGMGCCVPAGAAAPFCVDQASAKTACGGGVFMGCVKSDSTSESACCWNGTGAGAITAYAGSCGARPLACSTAQDCPADVACKTLACNGVTVGACGVAPVCP